MIAPGPANLLVLAASRPRSDEEHFQQIALFTWADSAGAQAAHPELSAMFAVPNWFGTQTARQGARAKAEGRRKGMCDVILPVPRGGCAALFIEMKTVDGVVRPEQRACHARLRSCGNRVEVCRTFDEARRVILAYLAEPVTDGIRIERAV